MQPIQDIISCLEGAASRTLERCSFRNRVSRQANPWNHSYEETGRKTTIFATSTTPPNRLYLVYLHPCERSNTPPNGIEPFAAVRSSRTTALGRLLAGHKTVGQRATLINFNNRERLRYRLDASDHLRRLSIVAPLKMFCWNRPMRNGL